MSSLSDAAQRSEQIAWFTCAHCDKRKPPKAKAANDPTICQQCEDDESNLVNDMYRQERDRSLRNLRRDMQ